MALGCLSLRAGGTVLGVQSRKRRAQRCKGIFLHPLPPPSTCSLRKWMRWETGLQSEAGAGLSLPCPGSLQPV